MLQVSAVASTCAVRGASSCTTTCSSVPKYCALHSCSQRAELEEGLQPEPSSARCLVYRLLWSNWTKGGREGTWSSSLQRKVWTTPAQERAGGRTTPPLSGTAAPPPCLLCERAQQTQIALPISESLNNPTASVPTARATSMPVQCYASIWMVTAGLTVLCINQKHQCCSRKGKQGIGSGEGAWKASSQGGDQVIKQRLHECIMCLLHRL